MKVRTIGGGERLRACEGALLLEEGLPDAQLILLPIPTARDKTTVTGTDVPLSSVLESVTRGTWVAGYAIPREIHDEFLLAGARVYDAALDEVFLDENARLTANAALGFILNSFKRDVSTIRFGIVGYGRIGKRLVRHLLFLGASVKVYTTREALAIELSENLIDAEVVRRENSFSEIDVLVNTAPEKLFSDEAIDALLSRGDIIELASGNNFGDHERVIRLPSLPERIYPVTSGEIYARRIISRIREGDL